MNERIVVILLITAIVLSLLSVVVTLSINSDDFLIRQTNIIKNPETESANVGLVIEETPLNTQNG